MLAEPGVHLSWEDRSTGEEQFMIVRREGTAEYGEIGRVGENVTLGTSAPSNEATIAVP